MSEPPPRVPETEALLQSVPDVVYRYRVRPTRAFEYVSPSSTAVTGYTPEEHYADPELARRIVHPDDMPILRDATERPDPSFVYRIRWRHKDGHEFITEQRLQRSTTVTGSGRPSWAWLDLCRACAMTGSSRPTISPSTSPRRAPSSQAGGSS